MDLILAVTLPTILLGLIFPITIIAIRETVKWRRREVILDLEELFRLKPGDQSVITAFEWVKFKYFLETEDGRLRSDFPIGYWLLALIPFGMVTLGIAWFSFYLLVVSSPPFPSEVMFSEELLPLWAVAGTSAFLASYMVVARRLYRAIHNFYLSPVMFVDGAIKIMAGVSLAIFVVTALAAILPDVKPPTALVIVLAFSIGYFPEAAQRFVLRRSRLNNYKRERLSVYKAFDVIPIEIVDGIDTEIRDHLADFHIISVQNLATTNPLLLFVETPYGVYQVMDWVAQAQLCASVGAEALLELWKLGVRTIFDLERVALNPRVQNDSLILAVGKAMRWDPRGDETEPMTKERIIASIEMRLDEPHVHRLRQIYIRLREKLGKENCRFPPCVMEPFTPAPGQ